jgi:hypothetical protein
MVLCYSDLVIDIDFATYCYYLRCYTWLFFVSL